MASSWLQRLATIPEDAVSALLPERKATPKRKRKDIGSATAPECDISVGRSIAGAVRWPTNGATCAVEIRGAMADDEVLITLLERVLSTDQNEFVPEGLLCSVGWAFPAAKSEEGKEIAGKAEAYFAILNIFELIPGAAGKRWAEMAAESPKPLTVLWRARRMNLALLHMGFRIERARSRSAAMQLTEQLVKRQLVMWYGRGASENVRGWKWLDGGPHRGWVDWEKPEDKEWCFTLGDGWALVEPTPGQSPTSASSTAGPSTSAGPPNQQDLLSHIWHHIGVRFPIWV